MQKGLCFWISKRGANKNFPYDNNIALHVGDKESNVLFNRKKILEAQGYDLKSLFCLNQIHSNQILYAQPITQENPQTNLEGDGIILTQKHQVGLIMVADCNPILLYDSKHKVLALLHAGRAGIQKEIIKKAYEILRQDFKTQPEDIWAYIGPSIRACCYEVKEDVFKEDLGILEKGRIQRKGKIYLDLVKIAKYQFESLGIKHLEIHPQCTCCSWEYFSYRREGKCGRFGLFAALV
ncbi:MAG: peptidoglycan editing factor PgeF [Helicobacter sp.]|nr:peptidoglycan editing factor PgeF [Helicobacter sp.]